MQNLLFLMQKVEAELKNYRMNLGEPTYCLLQTGSNTFSYSQKDIPNELKEYFNDKGKILIDGDSQENLNKSLPAMMVVVNYYRGLTGRRNIKR